MHAPADATSITTATRRTHRPRAPSASSSFARAEPIEEMVLAEQQEEEEADEPGAHSTATGPAHGHDADTAMDDGHDYQQIVRSFGNGHGHAQGSAQGQGHGSGRRHSFSRSQVFALSPERPLEEEEGEEYMRAAGQGGADAAPPLSTSAREPIVNFGNSSEQRMRAASTSTTRSTGSSAQAQAPAQGRRADIPATLLRRTSSSRAGSQAAQAQAGAPSIASALQAAEADAEAERQFGPAAMTRPRISQMAPQRAEETISGSSSSRRKLLPDVMQIGSRRAPLLLDLEADGTRTWENTRCWEPREMDPLADLSLLRQPPRGAGCLYPGALFNGTQKSGRSTYDVSVRIVNVDLHASMLCGYLNIRGLTEDWPELTTYFDAEIIGAEHSFLTRKWSATEADDIKHWSRFRPFKQLQRKMDRSELTFDHLNKPFVFMRWKERFLVPDHRVRERDINGASYAGFYYVCVELGGSGEELDEQQESSAAADSLHPNSAAAARARSNSITSAWASRQGRLSEAPYNTGYWRARSPSTTRGSDAGHSANGEQQQQGGAGDDDDEEPDTLGVGGKMSGFYFHENSEP